MVSMQTHPSYAKEDVHSFLLLPHIWALLASSLYYSEPKGRISAALENFNLSEVTQCW